MTRVFRRYLLVALLIGGLLQPVLAVTYWRLLQPYANWNHHRVVDVTRFPALVRWSLVDAYVANTVATETKPLILVLGDSEPYGLHIEPDRIFSHLLARTLPDCAVFNISFVDGRIGDMEQLVDSLQRHGVHPAFVVFNIDITHYRHPARTVTDNPAKVLDLEHVPLWIGAAAATLPNVMNVWRLADDRPVIRPEKFEYVPLPADYLPDDGVPQFERQFRQLLARLRPLAGHVVVYMTPFATQSFKHYGFDETEFRALTAQYADVCRKFGTRNGVTCLDLSGDLENDSFIDIIHLNRRGHAWIAARLGRAIALQAGTPPGAVAAARPQRKQ